MKKHVIGVCARKAQDRWVFGVFFGLFFPAWLVWTFLVYLHFSWGACAIYSVLTLLPVMRWALEIRKCRWGTGFRYRIVIRADRYACQMRGVFGWLDLTRAPFETYKEARDVIERHMNEDAVKLRERIIRAMPDSAIEEFDTR